MKNRTLRVLLFAVILLLPSALPAAGWDWLHPEFNANNLNGVATPSATDAFAVGDAGTILRYDGDGWHPELVATHANFEDVWAASATDVFAVGTDILSGTGTILHYDGTKWEQQYSEAGMELSRVWGSSGTDVFAIGFSPAYSQSVIIHYDSGGWEPPKVISDSSVQLVQIWGLSSTEVFALGTDSGGKIFVYEYDGKDWSEMSSFHGFDPNDIWGPSASDLYIVGVDFEGNGKMSYYDGTGWELVNDGDWPSSLTAVWGTSESDIFAVSEIDFNGRSVIYHGDGATWSEQHHIDMIGFHAIQGSSASDVVAVGRGGLITHYDGALWEDVFKSDWHFDLAGIWGFSKPPRSPKSDVFLVGDDPLGEKGVILHYDGKDFDVRLSVDLVAFESVWGTSHDDLFAVGYDYGKDMSVIYHYDGSDWVEQYATSDDDLFGIWGSSGTDVFVAGRTATGFADYQYGTIYHYDGVTWSLQETLEEPYTFLNNVWGTSGSNVYAVGGYAESRGAGGGIYRGYIFHYDGSDWVKQNSVEDLTFVDIWGSSASDIFVVGHNDATGRGAFYHYDDTWKLQYETPADTGEVFMLSVGGSSGSDVYATGYIRLVAGLFHYDGEGWSFVQDGLFSPALFGIWAASADDVFVVGSLGTVLHYNGNSLVEPAPDQASGVVLDSVQASSVHLSCEEVRERYRTPFRFRPIDDVLSFSASVSPEGRVGTFRYRVTGVSAAVRNLTLYKLSSDGEPLPFEYARPANTIQDGMWWITDEDGGYVRDRGALLKKRAYFVNFAIQDNSPGGYDLSLEAGTIEGPLVLGTRRACGQMP